VSKVLGDGAAGERKKGLFVVGEVVGVIYTLVQSVRWMKPRPDDPLAPPVDDGINPKSGDG
jgi:hypothetical protein